MRMLFHDWIPPPIMITKEKLNTYEVYAISYDWDKKEFNIYVFEDVGIKYKGKDYVNKKFSWCYTAKLDTKSNSYKLTNIKKW